LDSAGAPGELQLADATALAPHTQPTDELAVLRPTRHATEGRRLPRRRKPVSSTSRNFAAILLLLLVAVEFGGARC
jgi:hypothetical protein